MNKWFFKKVGYYLISWFLLVFLIGFVITLILFTIALLTFPMVCAFKYSIGWLFVYGAYSVFALYGLVKVKESENEQNDPFFKGEEEDRNL